MYLRSMEMLTNSWPARRRISSPATLVLFCGLILCSLSASAAEYFSRSTGSFTTGTRWSTQRTGGTVVAFPGSTHTYTIQSGHNISITAATATAGITIEAGGTLTATTFGLTITGSWANNGGTFDDGTTATVTFSGVSSINGTTNPQNFQNVTVASGASLTINSPVVLAGNFAFAATAANIVVTIAGTNSLSVTGTWSMPRPSAGFTSTIAVGAGTLSVTGTFTMSATVTTRNNIMTISTGTVNLGALTTGTTGCLFTFTGAGTLNISGTLSGGPPALTQSTGTVNFTGASAQTVWNETFYNLGFSGAGTKTIATGSTAIVQGNWTVNSPTTMTTTAAANVTGDITGSGNITMGSGTINIQGDWTNSGTFTRGTGTVNYNGSGAQSVAGLSYNNLQVTVGGTKTLAANTTVNNILTVSTPATFDLGTFTVTLPLTGTPLVITGSLAGTGKMLFSGGSGQNVPGTSYYDLEFSGTGTKTIAAGTTITVGNNWTAGSATTMTTTAAANVNGNISGGGAITMGSGTITLGGAWSNNGPFTRGTGTVIYNGGVQDIAGLTYNNLQVSNAGIKTLAANTTVAAILTVNASSELNLADKVLTLSATGTPFVNNGTVNTATSTVIYGGTTPTIALLNYFNLTGSAGGPKIFPAGTIGIAGAFTPSGGTYSVDNANIVNFNGTGPTQTIPAFMFKKMIISGSGQKIIATTVDVNQVDIEDGPTMDITTGQLNVN